MLKVKEIEVNAVELGHRVANEAGDLKQAASIDMLTRSPRKMLSVDIYRRFDRTQIKPMCPTLLQPERFLRTVDKLCLQTHFL